jgi:hypothetical protein
VNALPSTAPEAPSAPAADPRAQHRRLRHAKTGPASVEPTKPASGRTKPDQRAVDETKNKPKKDSIWEEP